MKIDIAGVLVDNISKNEVVGKIDAIVQGNDKAYFVTPYSEMVVFAARDKNYRDILNQAAIAIPDGIGILWAAKYLSIPASNFLSALWQIVYSGASIIFNPEYVRGVIGERISGSRLIYDIAKLAADKNYSMSLVGGQGNVAAQSACELKKIYPNLTVKLALSGFPEFDAKIVQEIADSNSDILLIAYSPPKQEKWIAENVARLNVKLAIGLGGTFDYLAGHKPVAPDLAHSLGLEWLWRLITQPYRWKRMWNAIPVFIWIVYKYKIKGIGDRV